MNIYIIFDENKNVHGVYQDFKKADLVLSTLRRKMFEQYNISSYTVDTEKIKEKDYFRNI